ncbi:uncharacterized protein LOC127869266 [Dreissena polymorpha]|uniref:BTB domain-containing protein n=1 Tax=Dreissena polymorpha TaxID=45954 RepID=A0A9D4MJY7_DREPO|nr:uncharacterized protein LOC127869266 [Dreissena polymorpha]KAH3876702.1 hypothetical protein DPMN_000551 [Dreissena polymorpha]
MESSEDSLVRMLGGVPDVPLSSTTRTYGNQQLLEAKLKIAESKTRGGFADGRSTPDEMASFDDAFSTDLPLPIFYVDMTQMALKEFENFDEMYRYISSNSGNSISEELWYSWDNITSLPVPRLSHYVTFGEYLHQLYKNTELVDVKIEVEHHVFMAHRLVLACFSKYFSSLLLSNVRKTLPLEIKLLGVSPSAFATFLEFVYTGNLMTNPDDEIDLLIMAEYLDVRALWKRLNRSTGCLSLRDAVRLLIRCKYSGPLYTKAFHRVLRDFMSAVLLAEFMEIRVDNFCRLLASDDLMAPREYDVFQVGLRWIVHGAHERMQYTTRVMELVRFCHMSQSQLFQCVDETRMFADYTELRDLVLVANWIISAGLLSRREPFQFPVLKKRNGYATEPPSTMKKSGRTERQRNKMPLKESNTPEVFRASINCQQTIRSSYKPAVSAQEMRKMTSSVRSCSECQFLKSPLLEKSLEESRECANEDSRVLETSLQQISALSKSSSGSKPDETIESKSVLRYEPDTSVQPMSFLKYEPETSVRQMSFLRSEPDTLVGPISLTERQQNNMPLKESNTPEVFRVSISCQQPMRPSYKPAVSAQEMRKMTSSDRSCSECLFSKSPLLEKSLEESRECANEDSRVLETSLQQVSDFSKSCSGSKPDETIESKSVLRYEPDTSVQPMSLRYEPDTSVQPISYLRYEPDTSVRQISILRSEPDTSIEPKSVLNSDPEISMGPKSVLRSEQKSVLRSEPDTLVGPIRFLQSEPDTLVGPISLTEEQPNNMPLKESNTPEVFRVSISCQKTMRQSYKPAVSAQEMRKMTSSDRSCCECLFSKSPYRSCRECLFSKSPLLEKSLIESRECANEDSRVLEASLQQVSKFSTSCSGSEPNETIESKSVLRYEPDISTSVRPMSFLRNEPDTSVRQMSFLRYQPDTSIEPTSVLRSDPEISMKPKSALRSEQKSALRSEPDTLVGPISLAEGQPNKMPLKESNTPEVFRASINCQHPMRQTYKPAVSAQKMRIEMTSSDRSCSECQFPKRPLLEKSLEESGECANEVSCVLETSLQQISALSKSFSGSEPDEKNESKSVLRYEPDISTSVQPMSFLRYEPDTSVQQMRSLRSEPDTSVQPMSFLRYEPDKSVGPRSVLRSEPDKSVGQKSVLKSEPDSLVGRTSVVGSVPELSSEPKSVLKFEHNRKLSSEPDTSVRPKSFLRFESETAMEPKMILRSEHKSVQKSEMDTSVRQMSFLRSEPDTSVRPMGSFTSKPATSVGPMSSFSSEPDTSVRMSFLRSEPEISTETKSVLKFEPEISMETKTVLGSEPNVSMKPKSVLESEQKSVCRSEPVTSVGPKIVLRSEPEISFEPKSVLKSEPKVSMETKRVIRSELEISMEPKTVLSFEPKISMEPKNVSRHEQKSVLRSESETSVESLSEFKSPSPIPRPEASCPTPESIREVKQLLGSKLIETKTETAPQQSPETIKRFSELKVDIFVVGGFQRKQFEQARSVFNESWVRFCDLPSPRQHHAAVLVDRTVYLIGGRDPTGIFPTEPTNTVFAIEIDGKTWVTKPRMGDARMKHCACAVNEDIYVFGGIGAEKSILSTVEQFKTRSNTWTFIAMLTSPRYAACAATLGGQCFIAGGRNSFAKKNAASYLALFECYNPATNTWSMKSCIRKPRCYASLVSVEDSLYLCGGLTLQSDHSKPRSLYAIDVYRPQSRQWTLEADMMTSRHAAGVTVAGSRIYMIGGRSEPSSHMLRSVECYDTAHRRWCPKPDDLPYPAKGIICMSALQRL